jgi:hypothetical protein
MFTRYYIYTCKTLSTTDFKRYFIIHNHIYDKSSYDGESVNRLQMDIKHKMWYSNLEKTFITRHILHQHWYACPITFPVSRNLQQRSLLTLVSATQQDDLVRHHLRLSNSLREFLDLVVNRFMQQIFPTADRKHFFMNILCIESFCPQETHNRIPLFGSTPSRMVAILTTETNLSTCMCTSATQTVIKLDCAAT